MKDLKPCPFCGGEVKAQRFRSLDIPGFLCGHCGAVVSFAGTYTSVSGIAPRKAWNRRAVENTNLTPESV